MKNILEYLEQSAKEFPDKTAFADETEACTFAELRACARAAGSALAKRGCVKKPVPVLMEKSVRTIKILIGIVYAGGFYVVLDAAQPASRLRQILATLKADILVTDEAGMQMLSAAHVPAENGTISGTEAPAPAENGTASGTAAHVPAENGTAFGTAAPASEKHGTASGAGTTHASAAPASAEHGAESGAGTTHASAAPEILDYRDLLRAEPDDELLEKIEMRRQDIWPLYVMFTSGSTGVPKGVVVSHRSVIDFMAEFTGAFGITAQDVLGNQAPWDFDVSVKDIFAGLKTGATVQIIPRQYFSFPVLLLDFLEERGVTSLTWAVSALCILSALNGFSYKVPKKIRRVMFSGETMPVRHLNYWRSYLPEAMFVNLYGPTEITCNCTYYVLERPFEAGDIIPIGRAFANEHVFLLDEDNREVTARGKEGEICVSGTALALGYYNNPEQTGRAFVQNPLNPSYHERIYRTGDLGTYNERGELCFASRKDFQIKHMGHRIELGEIEAALEKVEAVVRGCCVFDKEKNKIVCFYQGDVERRALGRSLGAYLPDYMIPNVFRRVEKMPVTKNGKIDRKQLYDLYIKESKQKRKEEPENG